MGKIWDLCIKLTKNLFWWSPCPVSWVAALLPQPATRGRTRYLGFILRHRHVVCFDTLLLNTSSTMKSFFVNVLSFMFSNVSDAVVRFSLPCHAELSFSSSGFTRRPKGFWVTPSYLSSAWSVWTSSPSFQHHLCSPWCPWWDCPAKHKPGPAVTPHIWTVLNRYGDAAPGGTRISRTLMLMIVPASFHRLVSVQMRQTYIRAETLNQPSPVSSADWTQHQRSGPNLCVPTVPLAKSRSRTQAWTLLQINRTSCLILGPKSGTRTGQLIQRRFIWIRIQSRPWWSIWILIPRWSRTHVWPWRTSLRWDVRWTLFSWTTGRIRDLIVAPHPSSSLNLDLDRDQNLDRELRRWTVKISVPCVLTEEICSAATAVLKFSTWPVTSLLSSASRRKCQRSSAHLSAVHVLPLKSPVLPSRARRIPSLFWLVWKNKYSLKKYREIWFKIWLLPVLSSRWCSNKNVHVISWTAQKALVAVGWCSKLFIIKFMVIVPNLQSLLYVYIYTYFFITQVW